MDVAARVEALQEALARSEERVAQLEGLMGFHFLPPFEFRLTASEARVFGVIMKREVATIEACMAALYHDTGRDEAEPKIVDVFVCKIRKKLKPFAIEIHTVWSVGYRMEPAAKEAVAAILGPVAGADR